MVILHQRTKFSPNFITLNKIKSKRASEVKTYSPLIEQCEAPAVKEKKTTANDKTPTNRRPISTIFSGLPLRRPSNDDSRR